MKHLRALLICVVLAATTGRPDAQSPSSPVMSSRGAFFALSVADRTASANWTERNSAWLSSWRMPERVTPV